MQIVWEKLSRVICFIERSPGLGLQFAMPSKQNSKCEYDNAQIWVFKTKKHFYQNRFKPLNNFGKDDI